MNRCLKRFTAVLKALTHWNTRTNSSKHSFSVQLDKRNSNKAIFQLKMTFSAKGQQKMKPPWVQYIFCPKKNLKKRTFTHIFPTNFHQIYSHSVDVIDLNENGETKSLILINRKSFIHIQSNWIKFICVMLCSYQ